METRKKQYINQDWKTIFCGNEEKKPEQTQGGWKTVEIPHNWEDYQGYRCLSHGNLHGNAWYQKSLEKMPEGKHCFIEFEGAGSYLSLWVNDLFIGEHKGGRTCYTAEITKALKNGENVITAKTSHPEKIMDLPWVCGGCFGTPNTEGSQPLGIFRPVSVYVTGDVRIAPFGVEIITEKTDRGVRIVLKTELENLSDREINTELVQNIYDPEGIKIAALNMKAVLKAHETRIVTQCTEEITDYSLWELDSPKLYKLESELYDEDNSQSDSTEDIFGIRFIYWENFDYQPKEILDEKLLMEKPSKDNAYFNNVTQIDKKADIKITEGGVRIKILENDNGQYVVQVETELENNGQRERVSELESFVQTYNRTKSIADLKTTVKLKPGEKTIVVQSTEPLSYPDIWSVQKPYYHQVASNLQDKENPLNKPSQVRTAFGIYSTDELANKAYPYKPDESVKEVPHRFFINGKPVLLQGTCEYEHLLGNDHAFDEAQIYARMNQIKAAGFNAFREAHCPHNLRYVDYCDKNGIVYWAQMGAHLYFDNEGFRNNYMKLTEEWVKERRNSPCIVLWGLQNESLLPEEFAMKLTERIRMLDSQTSSQRKTTTCNGGEGSDVNIPQNWTGTYGGTVLNYGKEIRKQWMAGEYGQYRVFGKHEEGDMEPKQNTGGDVSEELFCYCLEKKVQGIEKQRDSAAGHFQWIFNSHANPGRETIYCLDGQGSNAIGVINSKGLLTSWGEPTDAYYMYRSHLVSGNAQPMVYIVSHTWHDRFKEGMHACDVTVYTNCDEVELFGDYMAESFGKIKKTDPMQTVVFKNILPKKLMLYAKGYVDGKEAAEDIVIFDNAEFSKNGLRLFENAENITKPSAGEYIYRINCGGDEYTDVNGSVWSRDAEWNGSGCGWTSWAEKYDNLVPEFGSVRQSFEPVRNAEDQILMQTYRYGREKLKYYFEAKPGEYEAELYFMEPCFGLGGSLDCTGWRVFDVAVNGEVCIKDMDLFAEAGCCRAVKKVIPIKLTGNEICISFPRVRSYQAVISAIAIKRK